eukprot:scaffold5185_cov198-Alexandrium_tamarense.AAC.1
MLAACWLLGYSLVGNHPSGGEPSGHLAGTFITGNPNTIITMNSFDPLHKPEEEEDPLSLFESHGFTPSSTVGGVGMNEVSGDVDLLGVGSGSASDKVASNDEAVEEEADLDMHECTLQDEDHDRSGDSEYEKGVEFEHSDDEDDDEPADGSDLIDMEGWNLRRHQTEIDDDDDEHEATSSSTTGNVGLSNNSGMFSYALKNDGGASRQRGHNSNNNYIGADGEEDYGINVQSATNAKGRMNDSNNNESRRGLFGWGKGNRNSQDESDDLLMNSDGVSAPSWSNSSSGGGLFRRRGNPVISTSFSESNNMSSKNNEAYAKIPDDGIDEAALSYGEGGITGDEDADEQDMIDKELEEEQEMDNELRPGDHIYVWQTYGVNPRAYQRHAVMYSVTRKGDQSQQEPLDAQEPLSYDADNLYSEMHIYDVEVTVVSFYHFQRHQATHGAAAASENNRKGKRSGCKRELLRDFIGEDGLKKKKPVHKVRYGRKVKKGILSQKASVGTALKKDQVGLILARVRYLLDHPDHLPDHNALSANGECAAMWCVTGRWCTLQGASILQITCVSQAGGALVAGGILSNLTILAPMPGLWGMAGWWWYVPVTVAYPFLVPMLVSFGLAGLVPLEILRRNRKKWKAITDGLNHEFWSNASPEVREEYFGAMATAEKEAEMRSFFGVREGGAGADDSKYMPLGGATGGVDDDSDEEENEGMAMQQLETSIADMNYDLSGKPPSKEKNENNGAWGNIVGSFRRKDNGNGNK